MTDSEKYYHSLLTFGMMPGLDRIRILLERLGNPQKPLNVIHTAGTNGKGTVCALIASVLQSAGYKTGLYSSPYIVDFRERIRINGEMISEAELDEITAEVKNEIEKMRSENLIITEFEAVTAAAFLYYNRQKCDFVVLETGLGGRFDATNVVENPLVSVITSISLDHVKILGNTTAEIAYEKCGIIKENCPTVTFSSQDRDALKVIRNQCEMKNSRLYEADTDSIKVLDESIFGSSVKFGGREIFVPFPGSHQRENCAVALTAIDALKAQGVAISEKAIKDGMHSAKNPARCEIFSSNPLVILDGCHNESSAKALCEVIGKHLKNRKIKALTGVMADKDVEKILTLLLPNFESVYTVTPSNPRAMKADELAEKIKKLGKTAESFDNVKTAYDFAVSNLHNDEALIVCGSLYLCSDIYAIGGI